MQSKMTLVIQLAVGLVFLLPVKGKLLNPRGFAQGVMEYQVLPDRVSYLAGLLLISRAFSASSNAALLRPFPYQAPERLVILQ
jgi:methylamine utilization protein MauE